MRVEVELERRSGTRRLDGIVRGHGGAQSPEAVVETLVVDRVRHGHIWRDLVEDREDTFLLTLGVIAQDLVEEAETVHGLFESSGTASRSGRGGVDGGHVRSERVVDRV